MTSNQFIQFALENVKSYVGVEPNVVWFNYILGNMKLLVMVPRSTLYYEVTYNRASNQVYFDKYNKVENTCIQLD